MHWDGKGWSKDRGSGIDSGTSRSKDRGTGRRGGRITDKPGTEACTEYRARAEAEARARQGRGRGKAEAGVRKRQGQSQTERGVRKVTKAQDKSKGRGSGKAGKHILGQTLTNFLHRFSNSCVTRILSQIYEIRNQRRHFLLNCPNHLNTIFSNNEKHTFDYTTRRLRNLVKLGAFNFFRAHWHPHDVLQRDQDMMYLTLKG